MEELKHCNYCKYYYSLNHQMICFYGGISKNFELMDEYNKTYVIK